MTQEELRAKLESYELKGEDTGHILFDRDEALCMTIGYNNLRRALYDYTSRDWPKELTGEVGEALSNLIKVISAEIEMYDSFAILLGQELVVRLKKDDE